MKNNNSHENKEDGLFLIYTICKDAVKGKIETEKITRKINAATVYFRLKVTKGAKCRFSYSMDGLSFTEVDNLFQAEVSRWAGANVGLFCTCTSQTNDAGLANIDWLRVEPIQ